MANVIDIFRRVEKKFFLTRDQYDTLRRDLSDKLLPDEYGKSTVCNLYLDTPDFRIIRQSIDAVNYKEKLRVRSYGISEPGGRVFLEIKKKYDGVVYKRRVAMTAEEADGYLATGIPPKDSQIMREIDYTMKYLRMPQPAVVLCYEREAFFVRGMPALRLTFDADVRYRAEEKTFGAGTYGKIISPPGSVLMEFKTDGAMPLWLVSELREMAILPCSFSKYGTAYRDMSGLMPIPASDPFTEKEGVLS